MRVGFIRLIIFQRCSNATGCFGTVFYKHDITIGDDCYIGQQSNIDYCDIGDDVMIGSGVHILSGNKKILPLCKATKR